VFSAEDTDAAGKRLKKDVGEGGGGQHFPQSVLSQKKSAHSVGICQSSWSVKQQRNARDVRVQRPPLVDPTELKSKDCLMDAEKLTACRTLGWDQRACQHMLGLVKKNAKRQTTTQQEPQQPERPHLQTAQLSNEQSKREPCCHSQHGSHITGVCREKKA
jgi:hypothetical protein